MSINYAEWAGRLSFHVEALLEDSGPDWFREQRRDNARMALDGYEAALSEHADAMRCHDPERAIDPLNLPGLAER